MALYEAVPPNLQAASEHTICKSIELAKTTAIK